jgi:peptide/nickel transport system permease protein
VTGPASPPNGTPAAPATGASPGPWTLIFRKLRKNRVACAGGVILILLYAMSCFAGFLAPYPYDQQDSNGSQAPPMLFGSYELVERTATTKAGKEVKVFEREWHWFSGGIHFHDTAGNFTLRPHVHPLVEQPYEDEHGDTGYAHACADRTVSVPIEFFVKSEKPHEVFSLLGLFPVQGTRRLMGVKPTANPDHTTRIYLLGTDGSGRDVLSRILAGSQISLSVGVLCICITMTLGMSIGGLSGYFGGWVDQVAMRIVELLLSVPDLYLMIVLGGIARGWRSADGKPLSSRGTYLMIVFVMAFVGWAGRARVVRGMVLSLRQNDYVVAARAMGIPSMRIISRHILPNTFSFAIVSATLSIPSYILAEVALSYLGLGIQEPEASWGNMLREAGNYSSLLDSPWIIVPGVFIFLTVLAFNFLGDGLRDAADPRAVIVRRTKT